MLRRRVLAIALLVLTALLWSSRPAAPQSEDRSALVDKLVLPRLSKTRCYLPGLLSVVLSHPIVALSPQPAHVGGGGCMSEAPYKRSKHGSAAMDVKTAAPSG